MNEKSLEQLVADYNNGQTDAAEEIIRRCSGVVTNVSRKYFLIGAEAEDLYQEGFIGLLKAIKTYDGQKGKFIPYAYLCVNSSVLTAIRKYSGNKNRVLNDTVPLSEAENGLSKDNPEDICIALENFRELSSDIEKLLSPIEMQVLTLYLEGLPYSEIQERLGKPFKTVDNALQRIRRKLRTIVRNGESDT